MTKVKQGFWSMPKSFYPILLIEFWERFAFYGVQAVAVLFFINKFGFSESNANSLFSSFSALLYAFLVFGGMIGDKLLGIRRTYLLGILFLIAGYAGLAFSQNVEHLYGAMSIILVGNVLFKTNATNYVNNCFKPGDPRLDSAFTYFYISINCGSLSSIIAVPYIVKFSSYQNGLVILSIGMVIALIAFTIFRHTFKLLDNSVGQDLPASKFKMGIVIFAALAFAKLLAFLLAHLELSTIVLYVFGIGFLVVCAVIALFLKAKERKGIFTALGLIIISMFFWVMYMQSATSMTLFSLHSVDMNLFGHNVPPEITQALNPLLLVLIGPIFTMVYAYTHNVGKPMSIPFKFVLGIIVASLSFFVLAYSCGFYNADYKVSFYWLVLSYALYSSGELLVSAIGLSMVSRLFPSRMNGFAIGIWFIAVSLGQRLGGQVANVATTSSDGATETGLDYLHMYQHLFLYIGIVGMVIGVFFIFFIGKLKRSINEVETGDLISDEKNVVEGRI